eukprot:GDKJ01058764.1.p1 GENE.GDKJ01058764.1~~GDKJ01058764.1.p1  ORF type:complete len:1078 (-),score=350.36 GDKJ01058764.1:206-3439(-)
MSDAVTCDKDTFFRRLDALYSAWEKGASNPSSDWHDVDVAVVILGKSKGDPVEEKTIAFFTWLLGYEVAEMLIAFHKDRTINFISSEKKLNFVSNAAAVASEHKYSINLYPRDETDGNEANMNKAIHPRGPSPKKLAYYPKEVHVGEFAAKWMEFHDSATHVNQDSIVPLNKLTAPLLAVKDKDELVWMNKAATLSAILLNQLRFRVLDAVERTLEKQASVPHKELSDFIFNLVKKPTPDFKKKCAEKHQIVLPDPEYDLTYAICQSEKSGFNLKGSQSNSKEPMSISGCVVLSTCVKYREYSAAMARTILIDPSEKHKEIYNAVYDARQRALEKICAGSTLSSVYQAAKYRIDQRSDIQIAARVGNAIGLTYQDSDLRFADGFEDKIIEPGMTFHLNLCVTNVPKTEGEDPNIAVWLADTVFVPMSGSRPYELLTNGKITPSEVVYSIADEDEVEEVAAKETPVKRETTTRENDNSNDHGGIRARPRPPPQESATKKLEAEQQRIRNMRTEELFQRLITGDFGNDASTKRSIKKFDKLNSYTAETPLPADLKANRIYVDEKRDTILCPIAGAFVPFHAAMIKTSTFHTEDGNRHVMRLNFWTPATLTVAQKNSPEDNPLPDINNLEKPIYVKELLFKVQDGKNLSLINKRINDLVKKVRLRHKQQQDEAELGAQTTIVVNKNRARVILKDLMIRPALGGARKVVGILEAHVNGFRYTANRASEAVDIPYANIKHAFFQRATESDPIVLVHFHLKNPILMGGATATASAATAKKKTIDVQFFVEAGALTEDLANNRRTGGDASDALEEQRERMMKKKINTDFERFCHEASRLAQASEFNLSFEEPDRDLEFTGVSTRSAVGICPTSSSLVHLIEGFFVLTLEDVQTVFFERIAQGLRNFDMVFVFKDLRKPVARLDTIPRESLELIKHWLTNREIAFYEVGRSIKWANILKTIIDEKDDFIEKGGFDYIFGDAGSDSEMESKDDDDDDSDSSYKPSGSDSNSDSSDSDSSDSDSGSDSDVSFDDSSASASGSYASEEDDDGEDWEEMEARAAKEDKQRALEEQEEARQKKPDAKKKK